MSRSRPGWTLADEARRVRHRMAISRSSSRADAVIDPVFVVSAGRTGSQLLADYLNSLESVSIRDEILNAGKVVGLPSRIVTARGIERHLRDSIASLIGKVRGAKLLLSQLEDRHLDSNALRRLFPEVRFVVLYRRSLSEQYVSLRLVAATGRYAAREVGEVHSLRLRVDPDDLRRHYERVKGRYRALLSPPWMADRATIVCYEDLVADPQGVVGKKLCPFLGVTESVVGSPLVKQNQRALADVVSNFDDIRELLVGPEALHDYS